MSMLWSWIFEGKTNNSVIRRHLFRQFLKVSYNKNYFQSGLGPQHLVHHHPQYVCSIMFGRPPPSPSPTRLLPAGLSTPPPERHSFCLLCGQRFLKKHVKLLALHLQQQHPKKFSQVMDTYFVPDNKPLIETKQVKLSFFIRLSRQNTWIH